MIKFKLLPGDKYDGRCAEIYITEKQFLIYHCSVCEEIYQTFNELLGHITNHHYKNTKEYNKLDKRSVETVIKRDEEIATKKLLVKSKKFEDGEKNFVVGNKKGEGKYKKSFKEHHLETIDKIAETKVSLESEDMPLLLNSSKNFFQRKKNRTSANALKSNGMGKTKINMLTRYQSKPNDERKFICARCGFAFNEKYNLRRHLLRHSNTKNLSCSMCPKNVDTKVEKRLHASHKKSERSHLCGYCGLGLFSSESLSQHLGKHRCLHHSLKCEQCRKQFFKSYHQAANFEPCNSQFIECEETLSSRKKLYESNFDFKIKHNVFLESIKEVVRERNLDTKSHSHENYNNLDKMTIEGEFILEQNFDEYELVQTLSDLECNKKC